MSSELCAPPGIGVVPEGEVDPHPFDDEDRAEVQRYACVVESIARAFGPSCEVVLHSLEDVSRSVVKIENAHVTGRAVGAPMTDFGLQILRTVEQTGSDVVGPYFTRSGPNTLRSVSSVLRNRLGRPLAILCINFDLSAPFLEVLRGLLPQPSAPAGGHGPELSEPVEHFPASVRDLIRQTLAAVPPTYASDWNRRASEELFKKGIFRMKGAVELAAEELGVSKHTIYYYLRDFRGRGLEE